MNPPARLGLGLAKWDALFITNSFFVLFLLCFFCFGCTVWVFLWLPAGLGLSGLPCGGVLSLGWMCGWSHTRGTWGRLFFPRPAEEVFDRHVSGPKRGLVFVFL